MQDSSNFKISRRSIMKRFRDLFREMGYSDGLLYLTARAAGIMTFGRVELRKYYFVSQPVPDRSLLPPARGNRITVETADRSHPLAGRFPRPLHVIETRYASGARCFLASKDGQFVGFLWLQMGGYLEDEVRCRFNPAPAGYTAWDFDVHIEPEHRNTFAFARLWDTANAFLRDAGVKWSVSRISAFKPGSINSHVRLGAFPVGQACFLNGRKWQLMISITPLHIHFSRGQHHVPEIRIAADPTHRRSYHRFVTQS
jgi:hypothetical protein